MLLRCAVICNHMPRIIPASFTRPAYRSKFNVALGIEAQGFCQIR